MHTIGIAADKGSVSHVVSLERNKLLARAQQRSGASETSEDSDTQSLLNVVLIDKRTLVRECLTRSLVTVANCKVLAYATLDAWLDEPERPAASVVVFCSAKGNDPELQRSLQMLAQFAPDTPMVALSDAEDPDQIVETLEKGVRGYIPTSVPLQVAVEAMRLVKAGGVYVPASSLMAARRNPSEPSTPDLTLNGLFTARQAAVVEALRRGKANKIIAYDLNMRESTVKVHVRNIMRKLKARNRTEVAFLANDLLQERMRAN
jgi:DNA-binding NarL/FixJ family response regulator